MSKNELNRGQQYVPVSRYDRPSSPVRDILQDILLLVILCVTLFFVLDLGVWVGF